MLCVVIDPPFDFFGIVFSEEECESQKNVNRARES